METILGYDSTNLISLNWVALSGIILGSVFTYYVFALRKWKYKTMTVIAFSAITGYLMYSISALITIYQRGLGPSYILEEFRVCYHRYLFPYGAKPCTFPAFL